jgi:hypothetical protein
MRLLVFKTSGRILFIKIFVALASAFTQSRQKGGFAKLRRKM